MLSCQLPQSHICRPAFKMLSFPRLPSFHKPLKAKCPRNNPTAARPLPNLPHHQPRYAPPAPPSPSPTSLTPTKPPTYVPAHNLRVCVRSRALPLPAPRSPSFTIHSPSSRSTRRHAHSAIFSRTLSMLVSRSNLGNPFPLPRPRGHHSMVSNRSSHKPWDSTPQPSNPRTSGYPADPSPVSRFRGPCSSRPGFTP